MTVVKTMEILKIRKTLKHNKAMAEDLIINALHKALVVLLHEVILSFGAAYKLNICDIVYRRNLGLELCRGVLCAHGLVNICKDLVLVAYIVNYVIDINIKKREAAHNYEAGNDYRDRGKGHKAMRENIAEALAYQISVSTQFHSCSTHPFRH